MALSPFEWAMLTYATVTLVVIAVLWSHIVDPVPMATGRLGAIAMTIALWQLYRWKPVKATAILRVAAQLALLGWWYPDTYEFARLQPYLDHIFAGMDQSLFGCQPALIFSQQFTATWFSEILCMGYVSYFPMIAAVATFYAFWRHERLYYAAFVILASFFLFYIIFILLPVAGPQFYYGAVGTDLVANGVFPDVGTYFLNHRELVPLPGSDGFFHTLVQLAHDAGERPTAAFPSSHVGMSVVLLWLAWEKRPEDKRRAWGLFIPLAVLTALMFFATFYIQAHYAVDAIAGLFTGTAMYFLFRWIYSLTQEKMK